MIDLKGKRLVVTGASSGIGLEIARLACTLGAEVCLVARQRDALDSAVQGLGAGSWFQTADLAAPEDVDVLTGAVLDRWEWVDGLVNNAGLAAMATAEETELSVWDEVFAVNVRGPFLLSRGLLPLLRKAALPSIVNISSTLAEKAIPGMAAYNASKAALNQLTRSMAIELAPGIRVNAIMPAVVDTPIHTRRGMTSEDVHGMASLHPMARVGRAIDIANSVVFLLSEASSWTTGAVIPVDGGMMAT